jgi:hypothetical protein
MLNKTAAGRPAAGNDRTETNYLHATGAIRGIPTSSNPRTPMHMKKLSERSYLIMAAL